MKGWIGRTSAVFHASETAAKFVRLMAEATLKMAPIVSSIVVLGTMTPAVHSPLWYQLLGAISEAEAKAATEAKGFVLVSQFARFDTPSGIVVTCTEDRWEVAAVKEEARPKLIEVACAMLGKLTELPVSSYGFNNHFDLPTRAADVGEFLARLLESKGLCFPASGVKSCSLSLQVSRPEEKNSTSIQPSSQAGYVVITHNAHFDMPKVVGHFDPTSEMRNRFVQSHEMAIAYSRKIADTIGQSRME